jgi:hypothetical protein
MLKSFWWTLFLMVSGWVPAVAAGWLIGMLYFDSLTVQLGTFDLLKGPAFGALAGYVLGAISVCGTLVAVGMFERSRRSADTTRPVAGVHFVLIDGGQASEVESHADELH